MRFNIASTLWIFNFKNQLEHSSHTLVEIASKHFYFYKHNQFHFGHLEDFLEISFYHPKDNCIFTFHPHDHWSHSDLESRCYCQWKRWTLSSWPYHWKDNLCFPRPFGKLEEQRQLQPIGFASEFASSFRRLLYSIESYLHLQRAHSSPDFCCSTDCFSIPTNYSADLFGTESHIRTGWSLRSEYCCWWL